MVVAVRRCEARIVTSADKSKTSAVQSFVAPAGANRQPAAAAGATSTVIKTVLANLIVITIALAHSGGATTAAVFLLQGGAVQGPYPSFRDGAGRSAPVDQDALDGVAAWCLCVLYL